MHELHGLLHPVQRSFSLVRRTDARESATKAEDNPVRSHATSIPPELICNVSTVGRFVPKGTPVVR